MEAAVQETTNLPAIPEKKKGAVVPLETGGKVAPIVPRTIEEVGRVAKAVIIAGLAPRGYEGRDENETISKIMIGIMKGAEVGLAPLTALANIAIINGRPTIWGDGAMALVQSSGVVDRVEQFYEGEEGARGADPQPNDFPDNYAAVYRIHRKGHAQAYEGRFSVKDAKRAHLWGNTKKAPWIEYPKRMLMMRARAFALRDGFADALSGLSIREEIEDLPPEAPAKADVAFLSDGPEVIASVHVVDVEPVAEPKAEPVSLFLPIPTNAEGNDYDAWVKVAEEVVRLIPTPRALTAWRDANKTTIDGLKHVGKNGPELHKRIADMIEGRRSDLLAGAA